jgi:glycosyltransferase involved in cell wall biosynthesis
MDIIYIGRYCKEGIMTGPEKVARRIYDNYTKKNKSVFIEYFFDGNKYNIFKKLFGKENTGSVNRSEILRLGIIPLLAFLVMNKPKVIHIITFERFAFAAFVYKILFNVKIIYTIHGLIVHENKFFGKAGGYYNYKDKLAEKIFLKYSDLLTLLSARFKLLLDSYYKINDRRIRYIKNGVDEEFHVASSKKVFNENALKVVFIADTDRKEKEFLFLKETLEKINTKIELYIVDTERRKDEIKLDNNLIKVFCSDKMNPEMLAGFLADKDVFISPSSYEPFGITTVECMAAGVIPVITRETGASELVEDGINGFLFNSGDGEKLNGILLRLKENTELRKNVSGEAVNIYDSLSWEKIFEEYNNLYKSL